MIRLIVGDCMEELRKMEAESVHCVATSPPYWGLRDYGIEPSIWGGDPECEHDFADEVVERQIRKGMGLEALGERYRGGGKKHGKIATFQIHRGSCLKCGAWRGAFGLEPSPDMFVDHLVAVFEEVKRVLRADGTLWLNLGDSYAGSGRGGNPTEESSGLEGGQSSQRAAAVKRARGAEEIGQTARDAVVAKRGEWSSLGLKPKDLVGVPWMAAFALRRAGWFLRQDIIWEKPNPMPESTEDRCTKAHEYLFLLTKGQSRKRTVQFANLKPERVHLDRHLGAQNTYTGTAGLCVELAAAIFNSAQIENDYRLPPFYAQEWKQRANGGDGDFVSGLPPEQRVASYAARLLDSDASTKEFLCELHRLRANLTQGDHFLIGRGSSKFLSPSVLVDGDATVAINDTGKICKIDVFHGTILTETPIGCDYFYDHEAIKEEASENSNPRKAAGGEVSKSAKSVDATPENKIKANDRFHSYMGDLVGTPQDGKRNKRSVWTVATQPFPEAHFATFPPALIEPCVLAGTSERGCCTTCAKGWQRVVAKRATGKEQKMPDGMATYAGTHTTIHKDGREKGESGNPVMASVTLGFYPDCACYGVAELPPYPERPSRAKLQNEKAYKQAMGEWLEACKRVDAWRKTLCDEALPLKTVPAVVLDPFGGAGTTGMVADRAQRDAIMIERNPEYAAIARRRLGADGGLFTSIAAE